MSPIAVDSTSPSANATSAHPVIKRDGIIRDRDGKPVDQPSVLLPPPNAQERYRKAGIDISGKPSFPSQGGDPS